MIGARLRRHLLGDRDRLGWWLVPLVVAVGLAGAVLAGSLAVVFSPQRVDRLTRETAGAQAELGTAAEDVRQAADEALAAFVATTFGLLVDPARPEVPLDVAVTVRTAVGDTSARVHSWQAERDLLLLRVAMSGVDPLPWRPAEDPVGTGDRVTAVGLTPGLGPVRIGGVVSAADAAGVITDLPSLELLAGGPVVDGRGRVVGLASQRYTPFSADPVAVPVRLLCDELLSRCPD